MALPGPRHNNTGPLRGRGRIGGTQKYPQITVFGTVICCPVLSWRRLREQLPHATGDDAEVLLGLQLFELEVQPVLDIATAFSGDALYEPFFT